MALSADKFRSTKGDGITFAAPVEGSATLYVGSLVTNSASGHAQAATDAAGAECIGVACVNVANTGADGAEDVTVQKGHAEWFPQTGLTQAQVGSNVVLVDDETVTDAAGATNDVKVGALLALDGTNALVHVGIFAVTDA
ncbi:MAG: hypothetical protein AAGH15_21740 [Myxococcota bacterium]